MADQLAGAQIAAGDLARQAREAVAEVESNRAHHAAIEVELLKAKADVSLFTEGAAIDTQLAILNMDFTIHEEEYFEFNTWMFLAFFTWVAFLVLAVHWHDAVPTLGVGALGLVFLAFRHWNKEEPLFYSYEWKGTHFQTLSFRDQPAGIDMRPDANSLQKMKHQQGLFGTVKVTDPDGEEKILVVSFEMVAQLTAPKYMTLATSDSATAWARIARAAELLQQVNFNRYDTFTGKNVAMHSALIAWALWCRQHEEHVLDFVGAPRL